MATNPEPSPADPANAPADPPVPTPVDPPPPEPSDYPQPGAAPSAEAA